MPVAARSLDRFQAFHLPATLYTHTVRDPEVSMLTEFARWVITDEYGRRRPSVCHMTEADAKALCPDAEKIPQTSEWRDLYPPDEAKYKHSISYRGEWDGKPGPTVARKDDAG